MSLGLSVLILGLLAALGPVIRRYVRPLGDALFPAVPLALGVWFALQMGAGTLIERTPWAPDLGLDLAFRFDGLSGLFALLICFIGGGVLLYASSYMASHPRMGSFMGTLTAFMASMLGLVLADNLILLFVFWELTSITSFLLIGFDHDRASAKKAAGASAAPAKRRDWRCSRA